MTKLLSWQLSVFGEWHMWIFSDSALDQRPQTPQEKAVATRETYDVIKTYFYVEK